MKISECSNAPQWLIDATTIDANITVLSDGWVYWHGGSFEGGSFKGGSFEGGSFKGGFFLDGYFEGGSFEGGSFLGGSFKGGSFLGGSFLGGYFLGGSFLGGSFLGGSFKGGSVCGDNKSLNPTWILTVIPQIEGYPKTLCAVDGVAWIKAGCHLFTLSDARKHWSKRSDRTMTRVLLEGVAALAKEKGLTEK